MLSKDRKENIGDCLDVHVNFKYPKNLEEFDTLLDFFQRKKNNCNDNFLGENTLPDRLIVMDDVSGLVDISENFANFLTVSRKFGFTCIYIFHTIYPTRNNWQMILLQTKFLNFSSGSIQAYSVVYFNISSSGKKQCLTTDTRGVDDLGPVKFRTQADNNNEQICYYNRNKRDKTFNCFLVLRKQTSTAD